jgi:hypothetical protein
MPLFASPEILKRRADLGLILAFLVFLWLPAADTFLHLDPAPSPNENRTLAAFPPFQPSLAGVREYLAGLETYFNDHFGFRRTLVRIGQRWKWVVFHDTRLATVLMGKGDWLFFSDGRMADDISGMRPFREAQLEAWRTLLTGRRDWLRARGIRYLFVIPPDKQSIYPEHLPDWLLSRAGPPRRIDQFLAYMRERSDVPILDLRETLIEAKKAGEIYLHTDTHWNERGALAASRRIVRELNALGIAATAVDAASFQEAPVSGPGGDLALMLGQENFLPENNAPLLTPLPSLPRMETRMDADIIPKKWIPGTEPRVSENPGATGKVVLFRDSYATAMMKFLGHSFGRTVYVWQQNWDKGFIERERPDVVIDEMLERFLIVRDAGELGKKDEQPEAQVFADN